MKTFSLIGYLLLFAFALFGLPTLAYFIAHHQSSAAWEMAFVLLALSGFFWWVLLRSIFDAVRGMIEGDDEEKST